MEKLVEHAGKILIIDAEEGLALTVKHMLEARNYQVAWAATEQEGWALMKSHRPDLILMDAMLPAGTEGFHFVWRLRNDPGPESRTPVLILSRIQRTSGMQLFSGIHDGHYHARDYMPVQGFLNKPEDVGRLTQLIEETLGGTDPLEVQ